MGRNLVELPLHLWWSGSRQFDMDDLADLRRVYEIVLREGTAADIRRFIDVDVLREVFAELDLPPYVRRVWQDALGL